MGGRPHHGRPAAPDAAGGARRVPGGRRSRPRGRAGAPQLGSDQWRSGLVPAHVAWELDTPEAFDAHTADATPDDVAEIVQCSSDPAYHLAKLTELAELGFDRIFLHHVGTDQDEFIDVFGERVLPGLKAAA